VAHRLHRPAGQIEGDGQVVNVQQYLFGHTFIPEPCAGRKHRARPRR
jgi:hypothetical protein